MKRLKGRILAGLLMTAAGMVGAGAFVQTAQPVGHSSSSLTSMSVTGPECPALDSKSGDRSCQDIHKQFLAEGDLTQADYDRIVDESSSLKLLTCIKTPRRPALLDGII